MNSLTIARLAEEFNVCSKTVRRAAARLGLAGELLRRGTWSARVFGPEEAERLRSYFRERVPEPEEEPAVQDDGEESLEGEGRDGGHLALPPSGHVAEFLDLLADLRDQLAKSNGREERAVEENRQLREVLSAVAARLPAPSAPPAPPPPPPRLRPRVVLEVVLLGWVGLLAGVLGAVVLQRLADVGVVTLPAWWPIG